MSANVAKALNLLGKDVIRTKAARPGKKGRADKLVARDAKKSERFVFTNNYDMVVAATEANTRLIWFYDQKQNSPTLFNQARLFFRKWESWEETLARPDAYCLRVSMARSTLITKEAARQQASRLDRRSKRKKREAAERKSQLRFDVD